MTHEAECPEVVEVALSTAFGDGADVVGVPERAARSDVSQARHREGFGAGGAASAPECGVGGDSVEATESAEASIAEEDLVAEISRVRAQAPLVDAEVGAEGATARSEDLELAPTAERTSVGAGGQRARPRESSCGECSSRKRHVLSLAVRESL